jgi:hypothetical protein
MAPPLTAESLAALPKIDLSALQEADGIFCSGTDPISRAIEGVTGSIFSHVGMATWDRRAGGWQILQAYQPEVQLVPLDRFVANYGGSVAVARWSGITPEQAQTAVCFGLTQLGLGYGTMTIADIVAHMIDRHLPPIRPDGHDWICSQIFQSEYILAGLSIPTDQNGFCDPGDCWMPPQMIAVGRLK